MARWIGLTPPNFRSVSRSTLRHYGTPRSSPSARITLAVECRFFGVPE